MGERLGLSGRGFVGGFCNSESDLLKEPIAETYCRTYCWDLLLELITGTYYWNLLLELISGNSCAGVSQHKLFFFANCLKE